MSVIILLPIQTEVPPGLFWFVCQMNASDTPVDDTEGMWAAYSARKGGRRGDRKETYFACWYPSRSIN